MKKESKKLFNFAYNISKLQSENNNIIILENNNNSKLSYIEKLLNLHTLNNKI